MKRIIRYINPLSHLGDTHYPVLFPFIATTAVAIISELYAYVIAHDPMAVGVYAILVFVGLIIYFSFRAGIRGGGITSALTIAYYVYIIYTRHYKGNAYTQGIETTITLAIVYFMLAAIIGGLKQKIDQLIEREMDGRRRLEAIVQQLPVGAIITDSDGTVVQANKRISQILGVKIPVGFKVGTTALMDSTSNGRPVLPSQAPLAHVLTTGKPIVGKEYIINRKDGREGYLQVSASAVHNKDGKIIAAASIITDITERKLIEHRKDDFVNMASHELKTPITSMKLYIDALMARISRSGDDRALKTLSSIKYQTERLQELVSDLLDVSRLQTGKLTFNKEQFSIHDLIVETVDGLQGASPNNPIVYQGKSSITVYADRFRIYQVLTNLITNAVKYSAAGEKIIIAIKPEPRKLVVSVSDHGIGIARDQQRKIFDRLYQVTDDREKTFPGFGMGLYISREIIKRHNGNIWVESQKGKGSTFYFSLPLRKS